MHERIRKDIWGYSSKESFSNDELIEEKYKGIRPAPGYTACPDHTEKLKIFKLLQAKQNIGVSLTESMAMMPNSSVSGYYFAHPSSKYFTVGKIQDDQISDYAKRKKMSIKEAEKNGLQGISKLPKSIKVLLENLLRFEDEKTVKKEQILSIKSFVKLFSIFIKFITKVYKDLVYL